tara:strand:- start:524 stop:1048 length:525 start_codon:yes stop_codon:yes gene_type:complete
MMNTTDRLFYKFMDTPDPDADPDVIWGKNQFVNMLLTDDDFYQKWGENCCEELTYEERYKIWFTNNYETGMEYNLNIEPDFENDYYEPTPKRKLKHTQMTYDELENWQAVSYRMDNEGIDYCFEHYSSFEEIKDEEFHRLRLGFLQYMKEIREYVDKKVDEGETFELDGGFDDE